jgi:mono/diheme cytochrome c family protein
MYRLLGLLTVGIAAMMFALPAAAQSKKNGEKVYNEYCSTCHQKDGKGLAKVYPPIANSDYIKKMDKETLIREVVFGKSGEVTVNGNKYNGVMAPLPSKYKDSDISDVMTYIFNMFGNKKGKVSVADVQAAKKKGKLK